METILLTMGAVITGIGCILILLGITGGKFEWLNVIKAQKELGNLSRMFSIGVGLLLTFVVGLPIIVIGVVQLVSDLSIDFEDLLSKQPTPAVVDQGTTKPTIDLVIPTAVQAPTNAPLPTSTATEPLPLPSTSTPTLWIEPIIPTPVDVYQSDDIVVGVWYVLGTSNPAQYFSFEPDGFGNYHFVVYNADSFGYQYFVDAGVAYFEQEYLLTLEANSGSWGSFAYLDKVWTGTMEDVFGRPYFLTLEKVE